MPKFQITESEAKAFSDAFTGGRLAAGKQMVLHLGGSPDHEKQAWRKAVIAARTDPPAPAKAEPKRETLGETARLVWDSHSHLDRLARNEVLALAVAERVRKGLIYLLGDEFTDGITVVNIEDIRACLRGANLEELP